MQIVSRCTFFLLVIFALTSCHFHCSFGDQKNNNTKKDNRPVLKDGAAIYNGIKLTAKGIKVDKAYLVDAKTGERIPDDNVVDLAKSVKVLVLIDSGWVEKDGKVILDGSQKVMMGNMVVLDKQNMFATGYPDGLNPTDAKIIGFTVNITLPKDELPHDLDISFLVRDLQGEGYVEGSYRLYSK